MSETIIGPTFGGRVNEVVLSRPVPPWPQFYSSREVIDKFGNDRAREFLRLGIIHVAMWSDNPNDFSDSMSMYHKNEVDTAEFRYEMSQRCWMAIGGRL